MTQFNRILLTGAGGGLGKILRQGLAPLCKTLRLSDRVDLGEAALNEEIVIADLDDMDAVMEMTKDVDAVALSVANQLKANTKRSSIPTSWAVITSMRLAA